MKIALGFLLAFLIGVGCRLAALPLPAPPVLIGAALVVAMTLGYIAVDRLMTRESRNRALCGGPTGAAVGRSARP
ncbi:XapX domain-containing protein [Tistlia consotensis]|uniref:XapX domain-containing protein n=1 Tax=Tistlia consotensis USBA 355 TaxID=560819 RepID=A0A1Y6BCF7_9PROT|nr:XapX domain-containing protein [Tistlia consotensis]SMF03756.1 XapX domain-containing protein [Tistlia consotensis USBA 355]SNR53988.1 XapX domain-containing protein [Tistlia consotensis]